jgi:hypothetical protein
LHFGESERTQQKPTTPPSKSVWMAVSFAFLHKLVACCAPAEYREASNNSKK